ncbi:oligosaccharide flippase family protein [Pseudarthrobacter sp. lyk4-40-TYG-27]|uniref:oligosaccharide flippase family protein n=1 Tax=Pseudarthrobacter sp. lyk4-40-TYG-27 TaxID=3040305 RepID=UPI002553BD1B|nr:oligosaccharide flippase family protein [Pseudarthrobacter sp. lyk4-40-TYG-27]
MNTSTGGDPRSVSSRVFINGVGNLVPPLSTLLIAPILAQSLGVVGRGELAAATAPYLLAVSIATLGLPEAVTQAVARFPGLWGSIVKRTIWMVVLSGLLATLGVYFLAPVLSAGRSHLSDLIVIVSTATAPALVVALLRGAASGLNSWKLVAFERILTGVFRVASIAALALVGQLTPLSASICLAVAPVLSGTSYLFLAKKGVRGGGLNPAAAVAVTRRSLLWYGSRVWFGSISGVLLLRVDQAIMAPLSSPYQLGLYAIAVNVSEVPLIVNTAVREVMFTSDAAESDDHRLVASARISSFVCLIIGIVMAATLFIWVPIIFGREFSDAIPAMLILIFAVVAGTPGSIAGAALGARGAPELRSFSLTIACFLSIAVLFALVPSFGAVGAAIATLVGNLFASHGNIVYVQRRHKICWREFYGVRMNDFAIMAGLLRRLRVPR